MAARQSPRRARLRLAGIALTVLTLIVSGVLVITAFSGAGGDLSPGGRQPDSAPHPSRSPGDKRLTPATGKPLRLVDGDKHHRSGVSGGFPHTGIGAVSAAAAHQEELDLLDDGLARQQLQDIAADEATVRSGVSDVRRARERAGLAPAGGPPSGLSVTTEVKAVRSISLDTSGDTVEVWLVYDRYAQVEDEDRDENPLRDEMTSAIYTWRKGDWRLTTAKRWTSRGTYPRAYDPSSPYAWTDGWREVSDV